MNILFFFFFYSAQKQGEQNTDLFLQSQSLDCTYNKKKKLIKGPLYITGRSPCAYTLIREPSFTLPWVESPMKAWKKRKVIFPLLNSWTSYYPYCMLSYKPQWNYWSYVLLVRLYSIYTLLLALLYIFCSCYLRVLVSHVPFSCGRR